MKTELAFTPHYEIKADADTAALARSGINNIRVGFNTTVRITRDRPERERRAVRWLGAYIHREKLTTEQACEQLGGATVADIRAALTNPEADLRPILGKIESLRSVWEMNLRPPAETQDRRDMEEAFAFAEEGGHLVEYIELTRTGKTTITDWLHLRRLGEWVFADCTGAESLHDFIVCIARACGISISSGKVGKGPLFLWTQVEAMFGRGLLKGIILDEGHYLWPTNITLKPKRVEHVRKWWDRMKSTLAIFITSTPQSVFSSNQALQKNKRWSPGQWEGRIVRFYSSMERLGPDSTPEHKAAWQAEAEKVARWHCPEGSDAIVGQMARHALASTGFYGAMVNALHVARFRAKRAGGKLTLELLKAAQAQSVRNTRLGHALQKGGK